MQFNIQALKNIAVTIISYNYNKNLQINVHRLHNNYFISKLCISIIKKEQNVSEIHFLIHFALFYTSNLVSNLV